MKPLLISALLCAMTTPVLAQTTSPAAAQSAPAATAAKKQISADGVARHYAVLVHASYSDAVTSAQTMQKSIEAFLKAPSALGLQAARQSWLDAREWYGQTEAFRFYGGPIDDEDGPEGRINAWPMDESYVDYVVDAPKAGIINNRKTPITAKALSDLNEKDGEENIATGWHAIEFLLWGQDLSDTGPGERPYTDFVDGQKPNADRRRAYLRVVTQLLVSDLKSVQKQWAPAQPKNYRAKFEGGGTESVRKIFVGLGSLSRGELAGERLEVALASQDQEDEHSCFSDNTHRDAVTNAQGIQNVWTGQYKRLDGTLVQGINLRDFVALKDKDLADRVTSQITQSVKAAEAIPAPFDQAIQGERNSPARAKIQKTIDSLTQQSKDLVEAAHAVGITQLTLVQPE